MPRSSLLTVALTVLALAGSAMAQNDPRIDADTGRHLANFAHPRHFDHLHMRLELDFPDINQPRVTGRQTLTFRPIGSPRSELRLDCKGPVVSRALLASSKPAQPPVELSFTHEHEDLILTLPRDFSPSEELTLVLDYELDFSKHRGSGLTFSKGRESGKSDTETSTQIHSQGQPESNSMWFPCHDFPNERLTTELIVTVADGYEVCSNGSLVSKSAGADGRVIWHWSQTQPHPNYLVVLVIGKFAVVELGGPDSARPGLLIPAYVPHSAAKTAREAFGETPRMIAFYEKYLDEPYPWDKYAQLCVRDFAAGGMENTSATTLFASAASAGPMDDLISHELTHQWFGDLITCKSWEHLWLNEGWASYGEALWNEHKAGPDEDQASRAYQRTVLGFLRRQRGRNQAYSPAYPAMVSKYYADPDVPFMKADDVYGKGALILHMLRAGLGDEVFRRGVISYIDRMKVSGNAETDDFRHALEDASGLNLERFFDQWAMRPGLPRLEMDQEWDDGLGILRLTVRQTQRVDVRNPAYAFSLPVYVKPAESEGQYLYLDINQIEQTFEHHLEFTPAGIVVDPNLTVLAATRIEKPLAMWLHQLRTGPTLFAQVAAAERLAADDDAVSRAALAEALRDVSLPSDLADAAARGRAYVEARGGSH